jgi:hypothetical protein
MRTSLNELKLIDDHLFNRGTPEDGLIFDALLILDPGLAKKVIWQKKAHATVQQYSRNKLKAEIETVHRKLFNEPEHRSFRQKILALFSKK